MVGQNNRGTTNQQEGNKSFHAKERFFLIPNWGKLVLFVIFALVSAAGMLQRAPIIESPPAQEPSPLGSLNLTFMGLLLAFPYYVPLFFNFLRLPSYLFHDYQWLLIAGNFIYLYLFACISVSGFSRYKHRFTLWVWVAIFGFPAAMIILTLAHLHNQPLHIDDLANYTGWFLILAIYMHLIICTGLFIFDLSLNEKAFRH